MKFTKITLVINRQLEGEAFSSTRVAAATILNSTVKEPTEPFKRLLPCYLRPFAKRTLKPTHKHLYLLSAPYEFMSLSFMSSENAIKNLLVTKDILADLKTCVTVLPSTD